MDEIAALTPTFAGVSYQGLDELGSVQWPCNQQAPEGTSITRVERFARGKEQLMMTGYVPTDERAGPPFPRPLTTGRILSEYNLGARTRRTENSRWHERDVLQIHPFDAEQRAVRGGELVALRSRVGEASLAAKISERMQSGIVYTTFHHPNSGANVMTTDNSDRAANCPEYKVTAVRVRRTNHVSDWPERDRVAGFSLRRSLGAVADAAE